MSIISQSIVFRSSYPFHLFYLYHAFLTTRCLREKERIQYRLENTVSSVAWTYSILHHRKYYIVEYDWYVNKASEERLAESCIMPIFFTSGKIIEQVFEVRSLVATLGGGFWQLNNFPLVYIDLVAVTFHRCQRIGFEYDQPHPLDLNHLGVGTIESV